MKNKTERFYSNTEIPFSSVSRGIAELCAASSMPTPTHPVSTDALHRHSINLNSP